MPIFVCPTLMQMSDVVDELVLKRRSAVPYHGGTEIHDVRNPIPEDAHLIPSKDLVIPAPLPQFGGFVVEGTKKTGAPSGKPWATYERPSPEVYAHIPENSSTESVPVPPKPQMDEEMWRTQYLEWTLQKNAYNPDIAAALRTNVRKQVGAHSDGARPAARRLPGSTVAAFHRSPRSRRAPSGPGVARVLLTLGSAAPSLSAPPPPLIWLRPGPACRPRSRWSTRRSRSTPPEHRPTSRRHSRTLRCATGLCDKPDRPVCCCSISWYQHRACSTRTTRPRPSHVRTPPLQVSGPAPKILKEKLTLRNVFPR